MAIARVILENGWEDRTWIDRHTSGAGWDPHPISLRTLAWTKLLLTQGALALGEGGRVDLGTEPPAGPRAPVRSAAPPV